MGFLATSTNLGTLEVLEIYVQYNGPRLLSCKNQASKIFLALWVDEEEDSDLWLYMLVSLNKLQSIRTGNISLRQAFSEPENDFLYEITYTYETSEWYTKEISIHELDKDCLPLEDTFLHCDPDTLPRLESQKVIQSAIIKAREIVNLILEPPSQYLHEFPVFELGKILYTFQPLIDQLSALAIRDSELKQKDIHKKSEFNIFATSPGSFQIELASSLFEVDIFGNSVAGDAIEKLFQLIRIGSDANSLQDFMLQANPKIAIKYRLFLEALVWSGTGLRIEWGSPTLTRGGSVEASLSSINEALEIIKKIDSLETKEYEITGRLFKVDTDSWKFGIRELRTKMPYKGDILEQARTEVSKATISNLYIATILEVPEITPATTVIKNYYKLADLRPYESSTDQLSLLESF